MRLIGYINPKVLKLLDEGFSPAMIVDPENFQPGDIPIFVMIDTRQKECTNPAGSV